MDDEEIFQLTAVAMEITTETSFATFDPEKIGTQSETCQESNEMADDLSKCLKKAKHKKKKKKKERRSSSKHDKSNSELKRELMQSFKRNKHTDDGPATKKHKSQATCTSMFIQGSNAMKSLPEPGKFLSADEVIREFCSNPSIYEAVPVGEKDNVFLFIDNYENYKRQSINQKRKYPDDCTWDGSHGTTVHSMFVMTPEGSLKMVNFKDNAYCVEKRFMKSQSVWIPLDPQPSPNDIIKFCRYYTKLKINPNYKKRVTTVYYKNKYNNIALVEYCGTYKQELSENSELSKTKNAVRKLSEEAILKCVVVNDKVELKNLPISEQFMGVDEVLREFSSNPNIYDSVPVGDKDNVYVFINNSENYKRRSMKKNSRYLDDCTWDSSHGSTVHSTFLMTPEGCLTMIYFKDNAYCIEKRFMRSQSVWIPLDSQPSPNDIIKVCRYYTKLKTNHNYKKRVTTVLHQNKYNNIALVEYCGTYREDGSKPSKNAVRKHSEEPALKCSVVNDEVVMKNLPFPGQFIGVDEVLREFSSNPNIYDSVPVGDKNNVYFFIDNSENYKRRSMIKKSRYPDDCTWDSSQGSTVHSTFVMTPEGCLTMVYLKDNAYCVEKRLKKSQSVWIPLDPQPSPNDVIKVCRYYTKLKTNHNYKKRVTTIFHENNYNDIALMEYCGTYKEEESVNSKNAVRQFLEEPALKCSVVNDNVEMKNLPFPGQFMGIDEVIKEFSSNPNIYDSVPVGDKDNVYVFIDNSENYKRRSMNKKSRYSDDCIWDSTQGSTVYSTFIMTQEGCLTMVNFKDIAYCVEKRSARYQSLWIPLDPQPSPNDIFKICRYYKKLKSNNNYKKRVTTVSYQNKYNNIALMEYCGPYKKEVSENSKLSKNAVRKFLEEPALKCVVLNGEVEMKNLPETGKFMTANEVIKEICSNPNIYDSVPVGDKENVFLFIDNYENCKRRSLNKQSRFPDDCNWDGNLGTSARSTYIINPDGSLKLIQFKDNAYCVEGRLKKKHAVWKPLDPQPSPNDIIKISRYYTKLKTNHNYKKRVTTIYHQNKYDNIALVEYCRTYKEESGRRFTKAVRKFEEESGVEFEKPGVKFEEHTVELEEPTVEFVVISEDVIEEDIMLHEDLSLPCVSGYN